MPRFDTCTYRCDEDGTPFCGNLLGSPTSLAGSYCEKCGGAYTGDGKAPVPTQPTNDQIEGVLTEDHGHLDQTIPAPAWTDLNPFLAFEAGKHSVQFERASAIEIMLAEQQVTYRDVLKSSPERLVQALLDRDRIIAQMGREIADGRLGGKLLREFVRACLASTDRTNDPLALQKFLEEVLGAAKADARQLKLKGTTL